MSRKGKEVIGIRGEAGAEKIQGSEGLQSTEERTVRWERK